MAPYRNEASIEIERPAAEVFPYLAAPERRLEWMEKLVDSEQVSDGDPALGTRFRDVFEDHGQRIELDAEIVEWEPNTRLSTRLTSNGFDSTATQRLEDLGRRTRLDVTIETDYKARLVRLMAGVITGHAQKQLEVDLERLKRLLEEGAA